MFKFFKKYREYRLRRWCVKQAAKHNDISVDLAYSALRIYDFVVKGDMAR